MSCEVSDKSKNGSSKADHLNTRIPYGIRPVVKVRSYTLIVFQSTHPVWDATSSSTARPDASAHFNPRIPYGMRPVLMKLSAPSSISIHASRMGCDPKSHHPLYSDSDFNPRIPYGMRPGLARQFSAACYFNPRIPYGMRRQFKRKE